MSIAPEARLTQKRCTGVTRARSRLTPKLRKSHHAADPANTPTTTTAVPDALPGLTARAENIAVKEMRVVGLVMRSINVEAHALHALVAATEAASFAGRVMNVRIPRYAK